MIMPKNLRVFFTVFLKFDVDSGEPVSSGTSFSNKFGECLVRHAETDASVCAITAAMGLGTGLQKFAASYPKRFFDVGIAEEHAVTFASGLAKNKMKPVFAVYSTFLQRCYDQLVHDVSLQKLKVVFAIDRAGFVGDDGETHNGLLDVPFLNTIPDITVYSPCCYRSLEADINSALYIDEGPVAVRYPRGTQPDNVNKLHYDTLEYSDYGNDSSDIALVTYGRITSHAIDAVDALSKANIDVKLISLNKIKPLCVSAVDKLLKYNKIYFFEEGFKSGGVGEKLGFELLAGGFKGDYRLIAVNDKYVAQACCDELFDEYKLDSKSMIKIISEENHCG